MRGCRYAIDNYAEYCSDRDVGTFFGEDLGERAGSRRRNFERHLVGFEFGDGFIGRDRLTRSF